MSNLTTEKQDQGGLSSSPEEYVPFLKTGPEYFDQNKEIPNDILVLREKMAIRRSELIYELTDLNTVNISTNEATKSLLGKEGNEAIKKGKEESEFRKSLWERRRAIEEKRTKVQREIEEINKSTENLSVWQEYLPKMAEVDKRYDELQSKREKTHKVLTLIEELGEDSYSQELIDETENTARRTAETLKNFENMNVPRELKISEKGKSLLQDNYAWTNEYKKIINKFLSLAMGLPE